MMPARHDSLQWTSDGTALVLTAVAAAVFLLSAHGLLTELVSGRAAPDQPFELSLQAAPPEASPAPAPPAPRRVEKRHRVPRSAPAPAEPQPLEPESVPADVAAMAAVAAPTGAAEVVSRPDLEALYAAELRADIDRRKHPPDSPQYRLQHPSGEVRVRFVVARSGEPQSVSIVRSSGSALLDREALKLVGAGHYPPMSARIYLGETQHTFVVTIDFPSARLTRRNAVRENVAA